MRKPFQKILYGSVEIGVNAVETFIRIHLLVFYSRELELPPTYVGIALSISILWDAAIDPLIGRFSDEFKAQKGTRIHLVLIGAIATALSLAALFNPPFIESMEMRWFYLLVLSLVFNSSHTLMSIPYSAMVGDYTSDRDERSKFIAWRTVFFNVGALFGIGIPGYYLAQSHPQAYANSSWLIVMLVLLTGLLVSFSPPPVKIEKPDSHPPTSKHPLWQALTTKPFLYLLAAYFVVTIGLTVNSTMALYFYRLRLQLSEKEIQNILLLFFLVFSLSVPFWILISRQIGRKMSLITGALLIGVTNFFVYPWLPVGEAVAAYIWAAGMGGVFVGCSVLMESVLTDVIDYDTLQYGRERFGLFFGVWKFSAKLSRALSLLLVGFLLDWANVSFPDPQTDSRLTLIFGPGVGCFFILAALFLIPYPLTEKKCLEVKERLRHGENLSKPST